MLPVPELLAPAGDLERLEYALRYGADAVYAGLTEFGMRSAPQNFTPEQLAEGAVLCHARGKKLYLTLNTLPTNEELRELPNAIRQHPGRLLVPADGRLVLHGQRPLS